MRNKSWNENIILILCFQRELNDWDFYLVFNVFMRVLEGGLGLRKGCRVSAGPPERSEFPLLECCPLCSLLWLQKRLLCLLLAALLLQ